MEFDSLKDYIPYAINMNTDNIIAERLPGESDYINGISFFLHDEEETETIINEMFYGINLEEQTEQNNV